MLYVWTSKHKQKASSCSLGRQSEFRLQYPAPTEDRSSLSSLWLFPQIDTYYPLPWAIVDLVNYIDKRLLVFYHHCVENNYAVLKVSTANSGPDRNRPSKLPENRYYSCCYSQSLKPWSSKKTRQKSRTLELVCFLLQKEKLPRLPFFLLTLILSSLSFTFLLKQILLGRKKNVFLISKGDIEAPAAK